MKFLKIKANIKWQHILKNTSWPRKIIILKNGYVITQSLVGLEFLYRRKLRVRPWGIKSLPGLVEVEEIVKGLELPQAAVGLANSFFLFLFWGVHLFDITRVVLQQQFCG